MKCKHCGKELVPINMEIDGHYALFWFCDCQSQYDIPDKKRNKKWKKEREEFGVDERETWSLNTRISEYILPRLKFYKKFSKGYPDGVSVEEWDIILDKMIQAFKIVALMYETDLDDEDNIHTEIGRKKYEEGMDLFRKYFLDLWW